MQLVLLSGGSGKRLWPLSNEARSKQFLPLLRREDGLMESMVQRVVRQAKEAKLASNITVATNASQLDIITNQLGENVSVVTEPERRDTFPAIALVSSFFKFEKQLSDSEDIVVMPCDPYTENSYFTSISHMVQCVNDNIAELVLMGITPTYPSEKYGYIIPDLSHDVDNCQSKRVLYFAEKPSVDIAESLLSQGALWNGGVFAFKLGYMMQIVENYIHATSFDEIRSRYTEFPKISFDYEVVEKAKSICVVPFSGKWKDLGTWNTLTEELDTPIIGHATMGSHCVNSHVINELQMPIYADGLKDMVVAASPDGFLVCSKEQSEDIKNQVKTFISRPMYVERRWGFYCVVDEQVYPGGQHSIVRKVTLNKGKSITYHRHFKRSETWNVVEGEAVVILDDEIRSVKAGESLFIAKGKKHAIKALSQLVFIEIQIGEPIEETDIDRFDYHWGDY